MRRCRTARPAVLAALLVVTGMGAWCPEAVSAPAGPGATAHRPHAKVTLHADATAVVPGQPLSVALRFEQDEGWHIYWQNPGDAGSPPQVKWTLPAGFTVRPLQFPVPEQHLDPGPIRTNILPGTPVLLAEITPPADLPTGGTVELAAAVNYLICEKLCVLEKAKVSLTLPVAGVAEPASAELFEEARAALPKTESPHLTLTPKFDATSMAPGGSLTFELQVDVKAGLHVQSDRPTQPTLVATQVLFERTDGLTFGAAKYPEAKSRRAPYIGNVKEFDGQFTIKVPVTVGDEPPAEPFRVGGLLTYQACTEQGTCYPPVTVAFAVPVGGTLDEIAEHAGHALLASAATESTPPAEKPATAARKAPAKKPSSQPAAAASVGEDTIDVMVMLQYILFGLVGGLILNVMPCVLPVISIKVLSFVQQAGDDRARIFKLGLSFCAGILVYFWVFALLSLVLNVVILQSAEVVIGLTAVMFVFGLSLFGVFEINLPGRATGGLDAAASKEGYTGAFMKGLLATLLGTACTAPFLATALAWAATQPHWVGFTVFTAAGVGMAAPYFLLSAVPAWMKFLPKPGAWMETFKQVMGFPLIGASIWLLWTLAGQMGADGVVWTVCFLAFLSLSCWLIGQIRLTWSTKNQMIAWFWAFLIAGFGGWFSYGVMYNPEAQAAHSTGHAVAASDLTKLDWSRGIPWQPYKPGYAEELAAQGYTVYIDYTARWCATCQANKNNVLMTDTVRQRMKELGVVPIEADYTKPDPNIKKDLAAYEQSGVPLNLIFPANRPDDVHKLPVLLTQSIVLEALEKAGPSAYK